MTRCLALFLGLGLALSSVLGKAPTDAATLRVDRMWRFVEAGPLSEETWRRLEADFDETAPQILAVRVKNISRSSRMLGTYHRNNSMLRFEPRFPFQDGIPYVATFDDRDSKRSGRRSQLEFEIPAVEPVAQHHVEQVYPTASKLPENLLKFYLHFSGPMCRGEAYRRIRLYDDEGRPVELPFLELGEELWDPDGKRLTLLFDPGRIKRGLKPNEDVGQVLRSGNRYTLSIDPRWPDASGAPLVSGFKKQFSVFAADYQQPSPAMWKLRPPTAEGHQPLVVDFSESLDHAMLQRVIRIYDAAGKIVRGRIELSEEESQWMFYPEMAWKIGDYRLQVDPTLEDLAGNSVGRPFEVLLGNRVADASLERTFTVAHSE